jgi:hypothetical protein
LPRLFGDGDVFDLDDRPRLVSFYCHVGHIVRVYAQLVQCPCLGIYTCIAALDVNPFEVDDTAFAMTFDDSLFLRPQFKKARRSSPIQARSRGFKNLWKDSILSSRILSVCRPTLKPADNADTTMPQNVRY